MKPTHYTTTHIRDRLNAIGVNVSHTNIIKALRKANVPYSVSKYGRGVAYTWEAKAADAYIASQTPVAVTWTAPAPAPEQPAANTATLEAIAELFNEYMGDVDARLDSLQRSLDTLLNMWTSPTPPAVSERTTN